MVAEMQAMEAVAPQEQELRTLLRVALAALD
jgi:hypothetical protein